MIRKLIKILVTVGTIVPVILILARRMHRGLKGK
jgi:uncharacterized membrane protein YhaH (DUF805 family)